MLFVLPALLALLAPLAPTEDLASGSGVTGPLDSNTALCPLAESSHGKVSWFKGTLEEAKAKALIEGKPLMLNFYTDVCTWCKKLDRDAFSDDAVCALLQDAICISIDAHTPSGALLAQRYPTTLHYPALIFLDPGGGLRDRIVGYKPTSRMQEILTRILADEDTLGDHMRRFDADPVSIPAIGGLAMKLLELEDVRGHDYYFALLQQLDPKSKSLTMRSIMMQRLIDTLIEDLKTEDLRKFLAEETHSSLLYKGWHEIAGTERALAHIAKRKKKAETASRHMQNYHEAHRLTWKYCPPEDKGYMGNHISWELYREWGTLDESLQDFAIETARAAVEAMPNHPDILDTLACCLFSAGKNEEAVQIMRRCIQLQPNEQIWLERLEMFLAEEI